MIQEGANGSQPAYRQIYDKVAGQIETGELRPGDVLPSERDYAVRLGVSRVTVRAALRDLVLDGLVVRQQGRKTTVAGAKINRSGLGFMSFTEDMKLRGLQAGSRVMRLEAEVADSAVAAQLNLLLGSRVIVLERVRLADGEPVALEFTYLPFDRFNGLQHEDLTQGSLYEILERRFGARPELADETVEASTLSPQDAQLLSVAANSPVLLSRRITRDQRGEPIESARTLYRADRYRMVLTRRR